MQVTNLNLRLLDTKASKTKNRLNIRSEVTKSVQKYAISCLLFRKSFNKEYRCTMKPEQPNKKNMKENKTLRHVLHFQCPYSVLTKKALNNIKQLDGLRLGLKG